MELHEFDFDTLHRKGVNNTNVEALSRLPFQGIGDISDPSEPKINVDALAASAGGPSNVQQSG